MFGEQSPAIAADLLVVGEHFRPCFTFAARIQVTELAAQLQPALGHVARVQRGIHLRRDVPVKRHRELETGGVRCAVARGQESRFALLVQRKRQIGRVKNGHIEKYDARVAGDADVATAVDVELVCAHIPRVVTRLAGGVAGRLDTVLARAFEQQSFGGAATFGLPETGIVVAVINAVGAANGAAVDALDGPAFGCAHQPVTRAIHVAAIGGHFVAQRVALKDFPVLFDADITFCGEDVRRRVVPHPVGIKSLAALAQPRTAESLDFLVLRALDAIGFHEQRHHIAIVGWDQQQGGLRFKLQAFVGAGQQWQRTQHGKCNPGFSGKSVKGHRGRCQARC